MTSTPAPQYTPAPHLIDSSTIAAEDFIRYFQDFYLSLEYVSAAPALVFERLMANVISSKTRIFSRQSSTPDQPSDCHEHIAALEEYRSENKILRLEIERLKARLESDRSTATLVRAVSPRAVQGIGTFSTAEVSSNLDYKTTKDIFFSNTYSEPPAIGIGLREALIYMGQDVQVDCYATDMKESGFCINTDWRGSGTPAICSSWLAISRNDPDFQTGTFSTQEDNLFGYNLKPKISRRITFTRAYDVPPQVVVWLAGFHLGSGNDIRIETSASDITTTSFILHIDTFDDQIFKSATVAWVACTANKPNVCTGTFQNYIKGTNNGGYTKFESGDFTTTPRVILAISSFRFTPTGYIGLKFSPPTIDATGIIWADEVRYISLQSLGCSFIALE